MLRAMSYTEYEPTPFHLRWTKNLLMSMKIGGVWGVPMTGQIYKKTGEKELTECSPGHVDQEAQDDMNLRLRKNLEAIGGSLTTLKDKG